MKSQLGIETSVIAQEEEAKLGWLTAVAGAADVSPATARHVLAWDSGGGSFQISARPEGSEIVCYNGAWGSTVAAEALMTKIQGVRFDGAGSSPNPVSMEQALELVTAIRQTLEPPPPWLAAMLAAPATTLVGIGGDTCIFRLAAEVAGLLQPQAGGLVSVELSRAAVVGGIEKAVGKSDEELGSYLQVELVVPKLCLFTAVLVRRPARPHLPALRRQAHDGPGTTVGSAIIPLNPVPGVSRRSSLG